MIDSFSGENDFLSNFSTVAIEMDGVYYPSVEHAYQAAKTTDPAQRKLVRDARTAAISKRLGRAVTLRKDWESVKLQVMENLLVKKFADPHYARLLLATDENELVEGNTWNDRFWGVCKGEGKNHLGKLLMKVRNTIKREVLNGQDI